MYFIDNRHKIESILKERFMYGNRVQLLYKGPDAFETIFDHIKNASDIICLEFYIYRNDETGQQLAELLKKKSAEGVSVYLLYDHFGSLGTPGSFWKDLRKSGIKVRASHPFTWRDPKRYLRRDHKKLIVIDGETAFTGGLNIANEYSGAIIPRGILGRKEQRGVSWRDTGVLIKGHIALQLLEYFKRSWKVWRGERIIYSKTPPFFVDGSSLIPIFASSTRSSKRLRRLILWSIERSSRSIHITTAYFTPGTRMLNALKRAAGRGVSVRILLPEESDVRAADYAARATFTRLLQSGVDIYIYSGTMLHAKTYLFDGEWSIIGSANLDYQSLRKNDEGNVGILDQRFGREMLKLFERDTLFSKRIDIQEWLKRPLFQRFLEGCSSFFRKSL
jgi:cardiolipin synthase